MCGSFCSRRSFQNRESQLGFDEKTDDWGDAVSNAKQILAMLRSQAEGDEEWGWELPNATELRYLCVLHVL